MKPITDCRSRRTKRSNEIRQMMAHMLTSEAPHRMPDGLPSWWPFWSDCLKKSVRELVHIARELEQLERGVTQ